jgi:hypothetical protein
LSCSSADPEPRICESRRLAAQTKACTVDNNTKIDLQNQLTPTGHPSAAASNALAQSTVMQEAMLAIHSGISTGHQSRL